MCLIMKIFGVHLSSIFGGFFLFFVHIFCIFCFRRSKSRYIRYRDNIGYPRYGESYNIGDNQYSSKNLSYCPINRFLESVTSLKRKAGAAAAATQAPAKKTCPHRTPQTPFESLDEETTYIVDKMVGMRWNKGSRQYLVRWKGYDASDDTWEPMENLVGCARPYSRLSVPRCVLQEGSNRRRMGDARIERESVVYWYSI
jgi:hypothetical protein